MKRILILLLLTVSVVANAADADLEKKWGAVIEAIAQVESERNPNAVSKNGCYVGYLQISKVLVNECNNIAGYKKYTYEDRKDRQKSIDMFIDYMEKHNPSGNMERAIRLWNSGDRNCMSRKSRTEGYYRRVMSKFSASASL